ncbi:MAG TPA: hypothetical protein VHZ95_12075 [Polyangiales bacterium]|nr:hypothetical protein [Polyangiales bacterium]
MLASTHHIHRALALFAAGIDEHHAHLAARAVPRERIAPHDFCGDIVGAESRVVSVRYADGDECDRGCDRERTPVDRALDFYAFTHNTHDLLLHNTLDANGFRAIQRGTLYVVRNPQRRARHVRVAAVDTILHALLARVLGKRK